MSAAFVRRLKRLLVLIPYVARRGERGVPVEEAARFAGCRDLSELYDDLDLAREIEVPPGAPDDFVELDVHDGRVFVYLPLKFGKPPRLTVSEGAALASAVRALEGGAGRVLDAALAKVRKALPPGAEDEASALSRAADIDAPEPPACREALLDAIRRGVEVEVDYYALSQGESRRRTLEPREVFLHRGHWYLAAWDPSRRAEHLYRLDRISSVQAGTRVFGAHKGPPLERYDKEHLYIPSGAEQEVEVRFSEKLAPLVLDQWPESATLNPDGSLTVRTLLPPGNYLLSWVLGYGGNAEVAAPPELRQRLAERVSVLAATYGRPARP